MAPDRTQWLRALSWNGKYRTSEMASLGMFRSRKMHSLCHSTSFIAPSSEPLACHSYCTLQARGGITKGFSWQEREKVWWCSLRSHKSNGLTSICRRESQSDPNKEEGTNKGKGRISVLGKFIQQQREFTQIRKTNLASPQSKDCGGFQLKIEAKLYTFH